MLSTTLYSAWTSMESIIGTAICSRSFPSGISPMRRESIFLAAISPPHWSYSDRTITYTFNPVTHTDSTHGTVALWFYRGVETTTTDYSSTRLAPSYSLGGRDGTPGGYSSTIGYGLKADNNYQTVVGFYNDNQSDTVFEIGNGTDDDNRSNAFAVTWDGVVYANGLSSDVFAVENVSISVSASSAGAVSNTKSVSKSGYYPLGVVGASVESGGAYSRGFYLTNVVDGSCTLNARLQASSTGTKNCNANILWVKTE